MLNLKAGGFITPEQQCNSKHGHEDCKPSSTAALILQVATVQVASSLPAPVRNWSSSVSRERGRLLARL